MFIKEPIIYVMYKLYVHGYIFNFNAHVFISDLERLC